MILRYQPQMHWLLKIEGLPKICCHLDVNSHGENMFVIKKTKYIFRILAEGDHSFIILYSMLSILQRGIFLLD